MPTLLFLITLLIPSLSLAQGLQCYGGQTHAFTCYGPDGYVAQFFGNPQTGTILAYDNRGQSATLFQNGSGLTVYPNATVPSPMLPPIPAIPPFGGQPQMLAPNGLPIPLAPGTPDFLNPWIPLGPR